MLSRNFPTKDQSRGGVVHPEFDGAQPESPGKTENLGASPSKNKGYKESVGGVLLESEGAVRERGLETELTAGSACKRSAGNRCADFLSVAQGTSRSSEQ